MTEKIAIQAEADLGFTRKLSRWLSKREESLFLFLAVIIGVLSGLAVVAFRLAIDRTHSLFYGSGQLPKWPAVILIPPAVGLIVAFLVTMLFRRARGSGVNQTKAAVYIFDGYIPFRTVVGKFVTCALAIGSGQSLGPEDPSLQMGAGIASALGRLMRISRARLRLIAPVGAAAGLAAAFNAPISAVLFVIEEVIGNWSAGVLGAIVLAAASSVVVVRVFMGPAPMFRIPPYDLKSPVELIAYAVLGVVGGVSSVAFIKLVALLRPWLKSLPRWTLYLQPAVAGLLIGVIGLRFPQVMGAGYESIDAAMHDKYTWQLLALLAAFKIVSTTLSFSTGTPGGMFAPTLFIGAMVGGAVGHLERDLFPSLGISTGGFALVGMGALFAGFIRAPMTSVFMVLEVSGNYTIILPVMISNTIAYIISRKYQETALFDLLARQDGVYLPSMEEAREQATLLVEDAMRPAGDNAVLDEEDSVRAAIRRIHAMPQPFYLVRYHSGDWSGVTTEEIQHLVEKGKEDMPLREVISNTRLPMLHPDQPLHSALRQIGDWPQLPVVSRADFQKLEGVISLQDILMTYKDANADDT